MSVSRHTVWFWSLVCMGLASDNNNLKELGVVEIVESKRGAIRKGLVHELLYAQDTVLCSYFAQREGAIKGDEGRRNTAAEVFQGLDRFG